MAAQLTLSMGRSARGLALCSGAGDQFLAGAAFAAHEHAAGGLGQAADFRFQLVHAGRIADQLAEDGRFVDEPLIIGFQRRLLAGADEGDDENVGQRNGEIEIGLAKTALIQIGVNCAERVAIAE